MARVNVDHEGCSRMGGRIPRGADYVFRSHWNWYGEIDLHESVFL